MSILEVGDRISLHDKEAIVINRWGRGKYHEYSLSDGRSFCCDLGPLFESGSLKVLPKKELKPLPREEEVLLKDERLKEDLEWARLTKKSLDKWAEENPYDNSED